MLDLVPDRRVALAVTLLSVTWATAAFAQAPTVLECNETAELTSMPRFDPPVRGPLTYEWRDSTGRIVSSGAGLSIALPVGEHTFTLVVTAETRATATSRLTVLVRDTTRPRVGVRTDVVAGFPNGAGADALEVARVAGFAATDQCDPRPSVRVSPTGPYPPGDTRVLLTATDVSGNSASAAVVMRVPRPAAPPRLGGAPAGRGESRGSLPAGRIPTPGALPPGRSEPDRPGGTSPSPSTFPGAPAQNAPGESPGPIIPPELPGPVTPSETVGPGGPPAPTIPSVPGASELPQAAPAATERAQAPPTEAPGAAPVIVTPGEALPETPVTTGVIGLSWWWLIVPGGVLLAGLLLFARRARDSVPPPLRASVRTVPKKDLGVQSLSLPPGMVPRFEIGVRPRLDSAPQFVVSDSSIVEERRTHA